MWSFSSTVGIGMRLWAGQLEECGSIPGRDRRFSSSLDYKDPTVGSTQPPVRWVPGSLSPRGKVVVLVPSSAGKIKNA